MKNSKGQIIEDLDSPVVVKKNNIQEQVVVCDTSLEKIKREINEAEILAWSQFYMTERTKKDSIYFKVRK
jgi:hypothetical protein